jgi:hypothetical protein
VSSKWFAEESIEGVENAALAFVPEEYLSPLPRGAASAMIRRLGKTAGLVFTDPVAETIAEACADMPFWIRKACSYIHGKVDVGLRPFEIQQPLASDYLKEFMVTDGVAMSEVALAHLFRVYPELRGAALKCAEGRADEIDRRTLRTLEKYGIIRSTPTPSVSGEMMTKGLDNFKGSSDVQPALREEASIDERQPNYGDWADELAIISRRRNLLEKKLRGIVVNFIRFSSLATQGASSTKERVLKCIDAKRRGEVQGMELDDIVSKLYWLELIAVIKKE